MTIGTVNMANLTTDGCRPVFVVATVWMKLYNYYNDDGDDDALMTAVMMNYGD